MISSYGPFKRENMGKLKVASIFTGVGGFELGLNQDRFEVILHAEHDPSKKLQYAAWVLNYHFSIPNIGDLEKVIWSDQPDFDVLVGGAPCQAFSEAGKRGGFEDIRGTMFFEFARALREKKPKYFVFENVKGLLTHDESDTIRTMFKIFSELGYHFDFDLLRASNFGIPQARDRVFIVGVRNDCLLETYTKIKRGSIIDLKSCASTDPEEKQEFYEILKHSFGESGGRQTQFKEPSYYRYDGNIRRRPRVSSEEDHQGEHQLVLAYSKSTRKYHVDHRIRIDGVANTLNTGKGCRTQSSANFVYNLMSDNVRKLTPLECERIQGWPDDWTKYGLNDNGEKIELSDDTRYKLIGNGIVPQVVQSVTENTIV